MGNKTVSFKTQRQGTNSFQTQRQGTNRQTHTHTKRLWTEGIVTYIYIAGETEQPENLEGGKTNRIREQPDDPVVED